MTKRGRKPTQVSDRLRRMILSCRQNGAGMREAARIFGVTVSTVRKVFEGR